VVLIVAAVVVILLASAIYIATEMLYPISFSDASRIKADEAAAIQSIHAISDAEEKYKATYPDVGYADSLAKLGGYRILGHPTADAAQLLPGDLAAGYSKGYIFTMNCMNTWSQSEGSRVGGCNLYAYPRIAGKTGNRGFCMLWGYGFWVDPKVNPTRGAQCSQRLK
jgi:type IV pilus assembly protein PilA